MLDESMFEDIHEIAENSAFLKAVEERDVCLDMLEQLPPYHSAEAQAVENELRESGKLNFERIFHEKTGFYLFKCFLTADYAADKAIFLHDVDAYKQMRFDSARKKIASLLFSRFVNPDSSIGDDARWKGLSVFEIINAGKQNEQQRGSVGKVDPDDHSRNQRHPTTESTNGFTSQVSLISNNTNISYVRPSNVTITSGNSIAEKTLVVPHGHIPSKMINQASSFSFVSTTNSIGVFGPSVNRVRERIERGEAPHDLFNELAREIFNDLKLDAFPRFLQSDFFHKYIQTKCVDRNAITVKDFTTFRALGRGGFGAVHACRKKDCGTIYAMKCINKKLVKTKCALDNVLEERNVLSVLNSEFITNLKYALQDNDSLYLVMDLMLGGDLKFHLINAGRFTEKRARFYAAQVLLGLEHLHTMHIIYRDMKLENVLLDHNGNCKLSDLGLAVVSKVKIKGYAGTPGYTAPEMIRNKLYGLSADIFSYGVMLYRMLCGSKPFKGKVDRDLDKAVLDRKPTFPKEVFSKEAISLLSGLLAKRPEHRLGCGERGIIEIKEHPFFQSIDWGLLEAGYIDPPFVPNKFDVNAASLKDIGDFDRSKYRHVKLDDKFNARIKNFEFINTNALQEEMVTVLKKADEHKSFEKFGKLDSIPNIHVVQSGQCCIIS